MQNQKTQCPLNYLLVQVFLLQNLAEKLCEPLTIVSAGMICFLFDASHENYLYKGEVLWRAPTEPAICLGNDTTQFQHSSQLLFNTHFINFLIKLSVVITSRHICGYVGSAIALEFALGGGKKTSLEGIYLGQSLTLFFSINCSLFQHRIF